MGISDSDRRDVARRAESAFADIVADIEQANGVALPHLKGIRYTLDMPADRDEAAQLPFFYKFPSLRARPYWSADDFCAPVRAVLDSFVAEFPRLQDEFRCADAPDRYVDGHTGYTGALKTWRHRIVFDHDMNQTEDGRQSFPLLSSLVRPLMDEKLARKCFFAVMRAGSRLANHCGGTNLYLRMHLGVVIPDGDLGLRVGGAVRRWREGEIILFDDSFGHEAWNLSDRDRHVLLLRILHPDLTDAEREWLPSVMRTFAATDAAKAASRAVREMGYLGA